MKREYETISTRSLPLAVQIVSYSLFILAITLHLAGDVKAQTSENDAARAQQLLTRVRAALGGEANIKSIRSLSLSGNYRHWGRESETVGEIKIDMLTPDRFLKIKESNLQRMTFVTLMLAINGDKAWFDRKVSRPVADDGSSEIVRTQSTAPPEIRDSTTGMRNTAAGATVIRSSQPGSSSTTERSVLGMRIPTPQGGTRNSSLSRIEEDVKVSARSADSSNRPPGLEDPQVRAALEKQLRWEFACLMFAWMTTPPSSFTLQFSHAGEIKNEHGNVEAIDLSGPDDFAARLFVDQASSRPAMISYRELINQKTGYVISAGENGRSKETKPEDLQEIAIQLYFSDYRNVNNVMVPFQIVKAINGVPVEEWKIEKYKINPDLKLKNFEKK